MNNANRRVSINRNILQLRENHILLKKMWGIEMKTLSRCCMYKQQKDY